MNQPTKNQATFTHMKDGKAEDWQVIASSSGNSPKACQIEFYRTSKCWRATLVVFRLTG